jgi:2,4-dienoyl-CoA reductase-like NADH-dependent reductase (Old Yellow Enzyme family)
MTTVKLGYGTKKGQVTERHVAFCVHRAERSVGPITTEPLYIRRNGRELPTQLGIHDDRLADGSRRLVEAVHVAGGRIMAQLIGDCVEPREVLDAVYEGFEVGRKL